MFPFLLCPEMDPGVMQDEVPYPFQMIIEELLSQENSTNNLASDAFGMVDSVPGETTVAFPQRNLTKDTVIAELDNLEYYEKVRGAEMQNMGCRPVDDE
jgi:hypothetical protein